MIIGNGLIASALEEFRNDDSLVIFASGVSNSLEVEEREFKRELALLDTFLNQIGERKLIYFSTCSIYDKSLKTPYIDHKLRMEKFIHSQCRNYLIIRLPNIVGTKGNKNTLINFFIDSIKKNTTIQVWRNAVRNILSTEDLKASLKIIIDKGWCNKTINIANPISYSVPEIIDAIEDHLGIKAVKMYVDKGESFKINIELCENIMNSINKDFSINYFKRILNQYY